MKSSSKIVLFISISLLCGIWVAGTYGHYIPIYSGWNSTRLWVFEFPPFSSSFLISMICISFAGMLLGTMARKYATQVESKSGIGFASAITFLNVVILIVPVLNLVAMFTPRTLIGVVDFKIKIEGRGYICVTEIAAGNSWSEEVNFNDHTVIYEQGQRVDQDKEIVGIDTIQPGQIVEIRYVDSDTSMTQGIQSLSITIFDGQYRPYKDENCGNLLP